MIITSGGIYGFLSGAYQETATKSELLDKSLSILNQKQIRFEEQKEDLTIEKTQLNKSISDLRISLSNPASVSYYDADADQVITTTSSSTRRALQSELKTTIADRDVINLKLEAILDSISTTDMVLLDKEISNEDERELGPLKYLAETTGYPMGQVVNWFLLLIIFVFDPLAIAMVVAANFAFSQIRRQEDDGSFIITSKGIDPKDVKMSVPKGMKFNEPYPMEEDKWVIEKPEKNYPTTEDIIKFNREENRKKEFNDIPEEIKDKEDQLMLEAEARMNVIGQNGNDGLHYEDDDTDFDINQDPLREEQKEPNTDIKREMSVKEKIKIKADEQKQRKAPKEGFQGYTITNHAQPIINPNVLKYRNNRK